MKTEPATFWDNKILRWEKDKYRSQGKFLFYFDVNSSVKTRLELARSILKEIAPGRTVLELGCGSAQLMEDILSFGAKKYTGLDVSAVAIAEAQKRILNSENSSRTELLVKNINEIENLKADICFSLGLFDWLSISNIAELHKKIESTYLFHTFSEKRPLSLSQLLHRIYVFLMYGHKNNNYIPLYHTENEIKNALTDKSDGELQILRHSKLSFGCLIYRLPSPIEDIK